jgi:hypothetical protein
MKSNLLGVKCHLVPLFCSILGNFLSQETIPERGQSACLLKEDHLAVLYASGETLLNQASYLPPFWNGLQ